MGLHYHLLATFIGIQRQHSKRVLRIWEKPRGRSSHNWRDSFHVEKRRISSISFCEAENSAILPGTIYSSMMITINWKMRDLIPILKLTVTIMTGIQRPQVDLQTNLLLKGIHSEASQGTLQIVIITTCYRNRRQTSISKECPQRIYGGLTTILHQILQSHVSRFKSLILFSILESSPDIKKQLQPFHNEQLNITQNCECDPSWKLQDFLPDGLQLSQNN